MAEGILASVNLPWSRSVVSFLSAMTLQLPDNWNGSTPRPVENGIGHVRLADVKT
jgi:hypothetical protein